MILLVDVGNSTLGFGISDKEKILESFKLRTELTKTSDEYYILIKPLISNYNIDDVIISSVVPIITSALIKVFSKYYKIKPTIVGPGLKTGVKIKVDDPKSVGADLICDCAGTIAYADTALIIDLGTATKFIYLKDKTFMGCSIAPGVAISMKALANEAALLPNIELVKPEKVIGTNTITCMQSGIIYGAKCQLDGMIELMKKEIGNDNIKVIATGGLSSLIIPICNFDVTLDSNLTLNGILEIYKRNQVK